MPKTATPQATTEIQARAAGRSAGFSLIELTMAMVVTLLITGSIYGLMTSGSGAFRREPSLMDRQQQIRTAMLRIEEDVLMAGMNLGTFFPAFTPALDGAGGSLGVTAGQNHDVLEIRTQTGNCPPLRTQPPNPASGANLNFIDTPPPCYPEPGYAGYVLVLYGNGKAKFGWIHNIHDASVDFPALQQPSGSQIDDGKFDLDCAVPATNVANGCPNPLQNECSNTGNPASCAYAVVRMDVVRYQIGNDATGVPSLFRSTSGGLTGANGSNPAFSAPSETLPAVWQLVARGIEDMQVQYRASGGFVDDPGNVTDGTWDSVIREVQVTLTARALGERNVGGETTAANGVTAVRGQLTSRFSPRAALLGLSTAPAGNANRWQ